MLQLKELDETVARLDRALARATARPDDALAAYELACCLRAFVRLPIPPMLPADVVSLVLQVTERTRTLVSADPHLLGGLREALLDVAAAIAVQPWDRWVAAVPAAETDIVCPLHD
jgi:hypothetical protein